MALAKEKPLFAEPADIEDDLYAWSYEQAKAVKDARAETSLPRSAFPVDLTYSLEQLRDTEFLPGPPRSHIREDA